jgi:surface polysaccharide O-acyltransferase-like enzyme
MHQRRYDLDWLRIIAFALLILYHVGMFYVTWDWHVKSSRASAAIEPLMMLVSPWRLTLLFLISGAATRFMADKMAAGPLALSRLKRLLPPLLLAIFVIVPPQSYYEVADAMRLGQLSTNPEWLHNFYIKYVTASGHWCDAGGCLLTPTYNHMWFVAYLIAYTLAAIALLPLLRRVPAWLNVLITGPGLLITPWLYLWALRISVLPHFEVTHKFVDDWYNHTVSFAAFLLGFAIAKRDDFFQACERGRFFALILALAAWAHVPAHYAAIADASLWLHGALLDLQAWTAIIAAVGFAHRYLQAADGPMRRMLTEAIFPFYLVHQTIIVVAAYHLNALALPLWVEVPLLLGLTVFGCWLFYLVGTQLGPLRLWVGLPPRPRAKS